MEIFVKAEILCIGTELLHGDINNTNAQIISKEMAKIGIDVYYHSVVGDNPARMSEAYSIALNRVDLLICTGGLGPTLDDITKEILAKHLNVDMIFHEDALDRIREKYNKFNRNMPENNKRQAYFPEGARIISNENGTAEGCIVDTNGKTIVILPGPPFEMTPMVKNEVVPYLMKFTKEVVVSKKITVTGLGESLAETMILDLIENQSNPTIAPYASAGKCVFRITAKATNETLGYEMIEPIAKELLKRFGENAFLTEGGNLEKDVFDLLCQKSLTLTTCESCTGGLLSSAFTTFPGSSSIFTEGFITYTNDSKVKLGVNKETLEQFGAVSEEVAKEMAIAAANESGAKLSISITGIAGPDGGTEKKPVGTVCVGIWHDNATYSRTFTISGDREAIRKKSIINALDSVRRVVLYNSID